MDMSEPNEVYILDSSYEEGLIRRQIEEILEAFPLEVEEKKVLIKPNLLGPFPPESAIITHPMIVRALREALLERGAEVYVGDNPGVRGYGRVSKVGEVTGIKEAVGEGFVNISSSAKRVPVNSRFVRDTVVSSLVMEADLVISVPKFKTHVSTVITGAIKNSFGFLVGGEKARMHALAPGSRDFGELLVDIYQLRPPDLIITDAITGIEGNGPTCKDVVRVGKLLASDNGVAMDTVISEMMGIKPVNVPMLKIAAQRGLGPIDVDDIVVRGSLEKLEGFRLPSTVPRFPLVSPILRLAFSWINKPRLRVNSRLCTGCGSCARSCPVGAISMEGTPSFDSSKCIQCYCCYELCPEQGISINTFIELLRR